MIKFGYCCINETLNQGKTPVFTGRKLIRRTFNYEAASELALKNATDLLTILKWNESRNIKSFRIGSEMMPRASDPQFSYEIGKLSTAPQIFDALRKAGDFAFTHGHSLAFHPGAFVCMGSPSEDVRKASILSLERENEVAEALCANSKLDIPLNFHIGGSYGGDFGPTADRFLSTFDMLSDSLKKRVVIENDDKAACWSSWRLCEFINKRSGIPICFDFHHYLFCNEQSQGLTMEDEFNLARSTWNNRSMQVHYSQSPTAEKLVPAHGMFYRDKLPDWFMQLDNIHCHLESKAKELALIQYRVQFTKEESICQQIVQSS